MKLYTFRHVRNVNLRVSIPALTEGQARVQMQDHGILHDVNWILWHHGPVPDDWTPEREAEIKRTSHKLLA